MSGENINFGDKKLKTGDFQKNKKVTEIGNIDVNKILVSKEESHDKKNSFKYLIGYNDHDVFRPLCIKLPQMISYVNCFESNMTMSFKISDIKLLKKYNHIWKKVKSLLKKKLDSEPVYGHNDKYIKTKIKIYGGDVNTNFQGKELPNENTSHKCLSLITLDFFVKVKKKCYPQTLLEECKYETKKTKMKNLINDELEASLSDDDETDIDSDDDKTESDSKKDNNESNE